MLNSLSSPDSDSAHIQVPWFSKPKLFATTATLLPLRQLCSFMQGSQRKMLKASLLLVLIFSLFFHTNGAYQYYCPCSCKLASALRGLHLSSHPCPSNCYPKLCPRGYSRYTQRFPRSFTCCAIEKTVPTPVPTPVPAAELAKRNLSIIAKTAASAVATERELSIRLAGILYVAIVRIDALGVAPQKHDYHHYEIRQIDFRFANMLFQFFKDATVGVLKYIYSQIIQYL